MNKKTMIDRINALYKHPTGQPIDPEVTEMQEVRSLLQSLSEPQLPQDTSSFHFPPQPSYAHRSLWWWRRVAAVLALLLIVGYGWWQITTEKAQPTSDATQATSTDHFLPDAQLTELHQAVATLQAQHLKDSLERDRLAAQIQLMEASLTKSHRQMKTYQASLAQVKVEMQQQQVALEQAYQQQLSEWTTYLEAQHQAQMQELASSLMQWQTIAQDNSRTTEWLLTYLLNSNTTTHDTTTQH